MKKPRPKSNAQVRRMFGLAKPLAVVACLETKEYLEDMASHITRDRTSHISELTFDEANAAIKLMGGDPFPAYGNSKRAENHRKQQAGIKTIETDAHVEFIRKTAAKRNMTEQGLESLAARMNVPWPPQTTEQGNKLAEALKAMNRRDAQPTANGSPLTAHSKEPSFRRVA